LHAPSHRNAKGTHYIIDAVNRLKDEGILFDFILVEGRSNADARLLYEQADLVIDQLLAGWYGGLAVEVMALGKPVISYLRRSDLVFIPPEMREELPIIEADPFSIYSVLREWLTVRLGDLMERGARSREYVERWHDPARIARQMKADYDRILLSKN
jgi:glycosyltransferase involved in cell wall biosynthesis